MSNKDILCEAKRISDILISIKKSKQNFNELVNELINIEYKNMELEIVNQIIKYLSKNNYTIINIDNFEIIKM